jgi:hypothetical protein
MIGMIQGKSNKARWREKGYVRFGCAIKRPAVSDEESKEADPH